MVLYDLSSSLGLPCPLCNTIARPELSSGREKRLMIVILRKKNRSLDMPMVMTRFTSMSQLKIVEKASQILLMISLIQCIKQ